MITRGVQGMEPPLLKDLFSLGAQAPQTFCIVLAFQSALTSLSIFCIVSVWWMFALLHGWWGLSNYLLYYIIIRLNCHVSIFENMSMVLNKQHPFYDITLGASLLKCRGITPRKSQGRPREEITCIVALSSTWYQRKPLKFSIHSMIPESVCFPLIINKSTWQVLRNTECNKRIAISIFINAKKLVQRNVWIIRM